MTEALTIELSPHELEALQVVASSSHPANKGWVAIRDTQLASLLAMAKRLLEIESALEFMRETERAVMAEWYRQPGEAEYTLCPETILKLATKRGWKPPTTKGTDDV